MQTGPPRSALRTRSLRSKHPAAAHWPTLDALLGAVRDCRVCERHLPLGVRPVLRARASARILVVGQAPGRRVHLTGIPWDDASGERLRQWMNDAHRHFLGNRRKVTLAKTAESWREYAPRYMPLPHPSPRNQPWFKRHPWFEQQVLPALRACVQSLVAT